MSDGYEITVGRVLTLERSRPERITFQAGQVWALQIDADGIRANPEVPINDTAKAVFEALKPMLANFIKGE